MTHANSSAAPAALQRYVAVSAAQAAPMAHEAAMLAAALSRFSAVCTEYRVAAVEGLAARMGALETRAGELGGWVAVVAAGFSAADTGSLTRSAAELRPGRAVARLGFQLRIDGPFGISIDLRFQAQANRPGRLAALPPAALGVWFSGALPFVAPVIAYQGLAAAQRWLIAQTPPPWFGDLQRSIGYMLTIAGTTLEGLTLATNLLSPGRLLTPVNSLSAAFAAVRAVELGAAVQAATQDLDDIAWTSVGLALLLSLREMNRRLSGSVPAQALVLADVVADLAPLVLVAGVGLVFLNTLDPDIPAVYHREFWIASQEHVPPGLFHAITSEIDALARTVTGVAGLGGHVRPQPLQRDADGRVLNVAFDDAVPIEQRLPLADGTYALRPGVLMSGEQRIISYYRNEQVTLVRLNANDFVVGICGLDPKNMAFGPNGTNAVIDTAYGSDPLRNPYYVYVRDEFLRYIELIPPGSNVHLAGHSMGGGMATQLLGDPAVLAALAARNLMPQSLTTVGAVRPEAKPGSLPADITERHYVDPDDELAMNVGAGHVGYPGVVFIDDGDLTDPAAAHSGYADADYSALPADLGLLPYTVDPAHYAVYRLDPIGYRPTEPPHEPPPLYP